jgi:hypothetical protein
MDPLPGKAISSVPELANRTPFAFVVTTSAIHTSGFFSAKGESGERPVIENQEH